MTAAEKDRKVLAGLARLEELRSNLTEKEAVRGRYMTAFEVAKAHTGYVLYAASGSTIEKPQKFKSLPEIWWPSPDEVRELARDISELSNEIASAKEYLRGLSPNVSSLLV